MDINDFKNRLKSGNIGGWYIFTGEEDYLKKHYLAQLRGAVITDGAFDLFNHVVYDGTSIDFGALAEAIKAPPMMSDYKFIEWKFANLDSLKPNEKSALLNLMDLKDEYPYTVFAIFVTADGLDFGTAKNPSSFAKGLQNGFDILTFGKSTDAQLYGWLKKHFDAEGVTVTMPTLQRMIFRVGHSMEILNEEVIKLSSYAKANGKSEVTPQDVDNVTSSTIECETFALTNAINEKNIEKAFSALRDFKMRRIDPRVIIGMLEHAYAELMSVSLLLSEGAGASDIESFLKMHSYKTKLTVNAAKKLGRDKIQNALTAIRKLDASSKSGGFEGYTAIEIFIIQNI